MTNYHLVYYPDKDTYTFVPIGMAVRKVNIVRGANMTDEQFEADAIRKFDKFISENTFFKREPKIIKTAIIY
jgi:hypothetical protein